MRRRVLRGLLAADALDRATPRTDPAASVRRRLAAESRERDRMQLLCGRRRYPPSVCLCVVELIQ